MKKSKKNILQFNRPLSCDFFTFIFLVAAANAAILLFSSGKAFAQSGVSVALSDNLIVLDKRSRSGSVELVNLASDPTEFTMSVLSVKDSKLNGESLLRWAPRRTVAPANRTVPFRVSARVPKDLAPGEYLIRVGVTAKVQSPPPIPQEYENEDGEIEMGLAAVVPIVPTLPITVYYRHNIEEPTITLSPLVLTPNSSDSVGYFPVVKNQPEYSFVGSVRIIEKNSKKVINQGRLHLGQGISKSNVYMPRGDELTSASNSYCLQLWNVWPAEGAPIQQVCN